MSKLNTGRLALRAMLPVIMIFDKFAKLFICDREF